MATYECASCGMAVNASCAKCDQPLENDHLTLDDGTEFKSLFAEVAKEKLNLLSAVVLI